MGRKPRLFLYSFVALWFALYSICIFLYLKRCTKNVNEDRYKSENSYEVYRELSESITERLASPQKEANESLSHRILINSSPEQTGKLLTRTRDYLIKNQNIKNSDNFGFNVGISDKLPVLQQPDTRPDGCRRTGYDLSTLPSVSIVSPMFNEPLSSLLRHVHSLLARTPKELLYDIIIVDDHSRYTFLDNKLDEYFKILDSRIKMVRNVYREGLVRTRMKGARLASGEVIVFLDSHMEVNVDWLEPLLVELVKGGEKTVVQPNVVTIDPHNLSYSKKKESEFRGGFGWDLRYAWFYKPDYLYQSISSMADPYPTPVLIGCAVGVWRNHFLSTGGFDPGLEIWGGEHIELSFKMWMTGGRILTVPCSNVGHIFKYGKFLFGPGFNSILKKNLARIAVVWMDDYKEIFFASQRSGGKLSEFSASELASIEERKRLRRRLKSKSFKWFLKTVMPEMRIPSKEAMHYGEIVNDLRRLCINVTPSGHLSLTSRCSKHRILPENQFTIDKNGRFLHDNMCIVPVEPSMVLIETQCGCNTNKGKWCFTPGPFGGNIMFKSYGMSLPLCVVTRTWNGQVVVGLEKCEKNREDAFWWFQYSFKFSGH